MAEAWSEREVELIVKDYLDMLLAELADQPYNKTEHRRRLQSGLNDRSDGSIERKHQNISAVLVEMGVPYINGYKPLRNYQRQVLPDKVLELVARHRELLDQLEEDAAAEPEIPAVEEILKIIEDAPEPADKRAREHIYERPQACPRVAFDYIQREAANSKLGLAGELLVMNFEKESLAERVEHTARRVGDVAGFDIRSYETAGDMTGSLRPTLPGTGKRHLSMSRGMSWRSPGKIVTATGCTRCPSTAMRRDSSRYAAPWTNASSSGRMATL